jgi:hypothetical protein
MFSGLQYADSIFAASASRMVAEQFLAKSSDREEMPFCFPGFACLSAFFCAETCMIPFIFGIGVLLSTRMEEHDRVRDKHNEVPDAEKSVGAASFIERDHPARRHSEGHVEDEIPS